MTRTRTNTPTDSDTSCPDQLEPSQWFDRFIPDFFDVPEHRLLLAVLSDAVRQLREGVSQRAEVVRWIKGHDARIPFRALCEGLRIDADALARRLIAPKSTLPSFRRVRPQTAVRGRFGRRCGYGDPAPDNAQRPLRSMPEQLPGLTIPQALEAAVRAGVL